MSAFDVLDATLHDHVQDGDQRARSDGAARAYERRADLKRQAP